LASAPCSSSAAAVEADGRWHGLHDQLFAAAQPEGVEHGLFFTGIRAEVATEEGIGLLQLVETGRGHSGALGK
jgi:hypothetical protein